MEREFYTVGEIRPALGDLTLARIYQLIQEGSIPSCRIGGRIVVPRRAWEQWLADRVAEASARVEVTR